jgi:hypothetical protein
MSTHFAINFSHINANGMQLLTHQRLFDTMPWQTLDLGILQNVDIDTDLKKRAEQKFDTLKIAQTDVFDVIDVLALAIIKNDEWQDKTIAQTVANNWWLSALAVGAQQALHASLVLVLQYRRDPTLYQNFANTLALKALTNTLVTGNRHIWQDEKFEYLVMAILSNKPNNFASLALENHVTIKQLLDKYALPVSADFESDARKEWLTSYLKLTESQLGAYSKTINSYLNQKPDINFAVNRAELIFNNRYFKTDLSTLEKQTHKFTDIHKWLKEWSKTSEFMLLLGKEYRQILRCWLGAGNYYQLEKAVRYIAQVNDEDIDNNRSISVNRYIFWTNYQQHIVDYWLLIPNNQQNKYHHIFASANVKLVSNKVDFGYSNSMAAKNAASVPTVLLKFDNHYFIQPLVNRGGEADLLMTTSVVALDAALQSDEFDSSVFNHIEPCLVHDHMFLWQRDMALCLKENFNIIMSNPNRFVYTPTFGDSFINPSKTIDHRGRLENIERWYKYSRYNTDLEKWAISYQKRHARHG